jgi:hypothetical protein
VTIFYQEQLTTRTLTILDDSQILRRKLSASNPLPVVSKEDPQQTSEPNGASGLSSGQEERLLSALNNTKRRPEKLWPVGIAAVALFIFTSLMRKTDTGNLVNVWIAFALGALSMLWAFNLHPRTKLKYS